MMASRFMRETDSTSGSRESYPGEMARHSGVNILTTTIRAPDRFVTDEAVRKQIRQVNQFANQFGLKIAMELDVRLAREAFPVELQEMFRLREIALKASGEVALSIAAENPSDLYTGFATPYIPLGGKLVAVYAYERTVHGITSHCRKTFATTNQVSVFEHSHTLSSFCPIFLVVRSISPAPPPLNWDTVSYVELIGNDYGWRSGKKHHQDVAALVCSRFYADRIVGGDRDYSNSRGPAASGPCPGQEEGPGDILHEQL